MRKNKHLSLMLLMAFTIAAGCKKMNVAPVDFDVTTATAKYKVGDTVRFNFAGNPDNISFYSGEAGFRYENRDRIIANGQPQLNFTTYRRNENTGTQLNTLFLYASTDFSGKVDAQSVAAAKWTDLTSRATFSTGLDLTPSGTLDLSEFVSDKPLYLAFKNVGYAGSIQRIWNVKSFNVVNVLQNEPASAITDLDNAGWSTLNLSGSIEWTITKGNVYFYGPASPTTIGVANEDWLISKPLFLNKVFPDKCIVLKNMSTRLDSYSYVFTAPGTYNVAFVASNMTVDAAQQTVKQLKIEIVP